MRPDDHILKQCQVFYLHPVMTLRKVNSIAYRTEPVPRVRVGLVSFLVQEVQPLNVCFAGIKMREADGDEPDGDARTNGIGTFFQPLIDNGEGKHDATDTPTQISDTNHIYNTDEVGLGPATRGLRHTQTSFPEKVDILTWTIPNRYVLIAEQGGRDHRDMEIQLDFMIIQEFSIDNAGDLTVTKGNWSLTHDWGTGAYRE